MDTITHRSHHNDSSHLNPCNQCSSGGNVIQSPISQQLEHETVLIPPPVYQRNNNYGTAGTAEEENELQQRVEVNNYDHYSRPPSYKDHKKDMRCL
ncbi:hypothetical protein INT45_012763 [Circinella minor]|uniref:Uncharacterized protein n=1 Tax=Circinella minor TaxID=1195481 RepID=A0A8H7S854_9FUNG|nr:hypothetical protein INT45_012763 [Circinella minor]